MSQLLPLRIALALLLSLALLAALTLLLLFTETAFNVWDRLGQADVAVRSAWAALFLGFGLGGGWLVWRLLRPRPPEAAPGARATPPSEEVLHQRLQQAEAAGLDISTLQAELDELRQRRETGEIHVALFGQISTGKSSVLRALLPDAEVEIDVRGGSTRERRQHRWTSPAGDRLILTDLPGLNEAGGDLDPVARDEARRAHLVVYLCDGDLSRDQIEALRALLAFGKPTILGLNKSDRYAAAELATLEQRLQVHLGQLRAELPKPPPVELVRLSSGGEEELIRLRADGQEERVTRQRPAEVGQLRQAIQRCIDRDPAQLAALRDAAVFVLTQERLDTSLAAHRQGQAEALVRGHTRKAVIGAMAAVAPGTDLLIQGYLGYDLVRELCRVYDVPARSLDIETLVKGASARVGKRLPLLLAIVGNAFKAFPGVGTLAGGLTHAVAYGLIFDSLGHAVAETLARRGALAPAPTLIAFEDRLVEDVETRTRGLARLALAHLQAQTRRNDPRP